MYKHREESIKIHCILVHHMSTDLKKNYLDSVATDPRCGEIVNDDFSASLLSMSAPVKDFLKSVDILDRYGQECVVSAVLLGHDVCIVLCNAGKASADCAVPLD